MQEHHGLTHGSFTPGIPWSTLQGGKRGEGDSQGHLPLPRHPHAQLSRQRQTLGSSVWAGSRSCFHFISQSSRTVSHRHEKPQKQRSPSPTAASQKQGTRKNVVENTLDFKKQTKHPPPPPPPAGPAEGEKQEASTAILLLCDLGQVTISLCLHFFSICQMEIIKAVLKLE